MNKACKVRLALAAMLVALGGCSGDISNTSSPIDLVLSTSQTLQQIDLLSGSANCDQNVAIVTIEARQKNASLDPRFLDVRLTSYRVTYHRIDGGTAVPPDFVRAIDVLIAPGGTSTGVNFNITDFGTIFNQAPFVSLLPQNGGVDPETKQRRILFNVTLEVFGQTLAGDRVSGSTTLPLNFCFDCGGCKG